MKKPQWIISLALAACCSWASPALAESPKEYVKGILDRVMTIQTNPALEGEAHEAQRGKQIHQIIETSFDFKTMARDALGPYAGQASGEFTTTFSYLFQDSYTRMVLKFLKKENVTYNRESRDGNKARVDTTIVRPNESIPVSYLLHQSGGGWLLYDVNVDGVSILENYRTQFSQAIRTKGFGFLLQRMKAAEKRIQPVLSVLHDQVLFLKHNLNARAIGSLQGEYRTLQGNVDQLIRDMQRSIDEADAFIRKMQASAD